MKSNVQFTGDVDKDGNPSGGSGIGIGLHVQFQRGPVQDGRPNGASVEDLIVLAKARLQFFQDSKFKCEENELAISHLELALDMLEQRTKDRTARGVEGTHTV